MDLREQYKIKKQKQFMTPLKTRYLWMNILLMLLEKCLLITLREPHHDVSQNIENVLCYLGICLKCKCQEPTLDDIYIKDI